MTMQSLQVEEPKLGDPKRSVGSSPKERTSTTKRSTFFSGVVDPTLTSTGLTSNMCLSIIGTTVLGIAAQMKKGGWIVTPLILILGCCIIIEMTWSVSKIMDKLTEQGLEMKAYSDFAGASLGHVGRHISSVSSTMALLGMICNGLIMLSKNMEIVLPLGPTQLNKSTFNLMAGTQDEIGKKWWALFLSFTTALYCFAPVGKLLKNTSCIGPFVCAGCIIFAWLGTGLAVAKLPEFPSVCRQNDLDPEGPSFWMFFPPLGANSLKEFAAITSYAFYCFAVVVTVPSLKVQMKVPEQMVGAASKGYIICTMLFVSIMLIGYGGFGSIGPDSVIDGMKVDRPAGWWATSRPFETGEPTLAGKLFSWMIIVNLLLTDAIYVPCTVLAIENTFPSLFEDDRAKIVSRLALVFLRFKVACGVKSFIALTSLTSSLFCVSNNILMPMIAFELVRPVPISLQRRLIHLAIFLFGVQTAIVGSMGAIHDLLYPAEADTVEIGQYPREGISEACKAFYLLATADATAVVQ